MNPNDAKFITLLKLKLNRTLTLEELIKTFRESLPSDIADLEAFLKNGNYEIYDYVRILDTSALESIADAENLLINYWIKDLTYLLDLTSPSDNLRIFINTYMDKFKLNEFLYVLTYMKKERPIKKLNFIDKAFIDSIIGVNNLSEVLKALKEFHPKLYEIALKALRRYETYTIKELSISNVELSLWNEFWRYIRLLSKRLIPSVKLDKVVKYLSSIWILELKLRNFTFEGKDVDELIRKVEKRLGDLILNTLSKSKEELDLLFFMLKYITPINELKFSPLSYDTVLTYLISKEFEIRTLAHVIYLLIHRINGEYLSKLTGRWVYWYGLITKST
ncbi:MAG TPA: hypothetical protein ENG05_03385 [Acidilobales archaeon]|nr:hypothetical protein [Acidilobales archaeon]